MLINKGAMLGGVALKTGFIATGEFGAATPDHGTFMWIVAVAAAYFALRQWVMIGETEFCAYIQVTAETGLGGTIGINDISAATPRLDMFAPRSMARFTSDV